jgi:nucleoside-diphosphate-sugar epimerase
MASVLVFGGLCLVGRHLVTYLVENQLCQHIRVVDRSLPQTTPLSSRCAKAFEKVEFVQANLLRPG